MTSFLAAPFLASGGLVFAFEQSTVPGKIVLFCLLIGSLLSWSIMITKFLLVRQVRRQNGRFLEKFRASRKPLQIFQSQERFPGSPLFEVYDSGSREIAFHLVGSSEIDETLASRLNSAGKVPATAMNTVRSALERAVGEQGLLMEDNMIILATAVSGGPFLGLLGTVWGVMDTFADIAMAGSASLSTMAPGVSGALITTTFGLVVAIPAMFGYNYLVTTLRALTVEMDNFAAEVAAAFEHRFVEHR